MENITASITGLVSSLNQTLNENLSAHTLTSTVQHIPSSSTNSTNHALLIAIPSVLLGPATVGLTCALIFVCCRRMGRSIYSRLNQIRMARTSPPPPSYSSLRLDILPTYEESILMTTDGEEIPNEDPPPYSSS